ncbi:hypothetical protein PFLUV_G00226990 [Perca fluviatilis]|uniref:Spermatogenesis-associated protein 2 PUB-like domain-containing protein n=1 Tax=Perca fluviatilis TaxID=8168 RepID=A0A6A5EB23_PERFL|nr:uncharacterized protein LOC120548159 isoform X1 [Perca fluviatilis]KAF1376088.1 hypothetical protein PFLUV_G00226990 [Perca fluviatilis]
MKDGSRTEEQAKVSRQELYEDYVNYLQLCPEVRPCRDACLLKKAAQYLLTEPEPRGSFTVFPFYQAVRHDCKSLTTDCREHLSAFIKATELLETLCVNLFLQPWKKEIKTLKTFTGPFVYCLLPVLSSSTIQSVLASIGYLPHTDTPQSEYRLSKDANPDRAMLLGFELLLARVECYHLLELVEKDQVESQEWLEVLQRRVGPTKLEEPTDKKTTIGQKEEEEKKKEDRKEIRQDSDTRFAVKPQPKPRHCHLISVDQSIMEMQMTYPDLVFRGRPVQLDEPQRANSCKSSSKDAHTRTYSSSTNNYSDDSKATELPERDCIQVTKAAAKTICCKNYGSKADEVFGGDGRGRSCNDRNSGVTTSLGDTISSSSISKTDGSRVDCELSGPQEISLHIPPSAGSKAEQSLKPEQPQPTAEPPAWTQQQTVADLQNKRPDSSKLPSLSSMDEEQDLRKLAERMGQSHVQETKEEVKSKEENKREEQNTNRERRKKERKASTEGEAQEQNLMKPVMETGPALSHAHSEKQFTVCHHSPLTVSKADCQSCKGGGSPGQREGEDTVGAETGRGEEEQLAQSYVIVENNKK